MLRARAQTRRSGQPPCCLSGRSAFSLIDLLVSVAVTAILIALLLPAFGRVTEAANRAKCASNIRQLDFAMQMYAQDNKGMPPSTLFDQEGGKQAEPENTVMVRVDQLPRNDGRREWDGIGKLFAYEYVNHPDVYFCPSHRGHHPIENYREAFLTGEGSITGNYQYRLLSEKYLVNIQPSTAVITDSLKSDLDYNHVKGSNVLRGDHSVTWYGDSGQVLGLLAAGADVNDPTTNSNEAVVASWEIIDGNSPGQAIPGPNGINAPPVFP